MNSEHPYNPDKCEPKMKAWLGIGFLDSNRLPAAFFDEVYPDEQIEVRVAKWRHAYKIVKVFATLEEAQAGMMAWCTLRLRDDG